MKKISILCLILILLVLTGCARHIEDVRLDNKYQILKYCKTNFGDCEVISSKEEPYEITYEIRDKEKNFMYYVTSYAEAVGFDVTFYYTKSRSSNFWTCYYNVFIDEYKDKIAEIESKYDIIFNYEDEFNIATFITGKDINSLKEAAKKLIEFENSFDIRDFWKDFKVYLYIGEEQFGYVNESLEYVSEEQIEIEFLMNRAAREMKVSKDDLTFIRIETLPCESIDGYADAIIIDSEEKSETSVCYFKYNNEEYFIADLLISDYPSWLNSRMLGNYPYKQH